MSAVLTDAARAARRAAPRPALLHPLAKPLLFALCLLLGWRVRQAAKSRPSMP